MKKGDFVVIFTHLARCIKIDRDIAEYEVLHTDLSGTWTDCFSIFNKKIVTLEEFLKIFKNKDHFHIRGSAKPFIKDLLTYLTRSHLT